MDLGLQNEVVLISGSTGGIGTALCEAFLEEKAVIVPLYRNQAKYEILHQRLLSKGFSEERIFPQEVDLGSTRSVDAMVRNVKKQLGKIDVLVNNAGASFERPFLLLEEEDWNKGVDVNLNNTARLMRCVLKVMFIARKGAVVNVSSLLSHRFGRGVTVYAASKAAVDRLTQALALEVGPKGIRINAVCPGLIDTRMSEPLMERYGDIINQHSALGRIGQPEEVAKAVLFLSSWKAASFITGHLLTVDGGQGI
jgi:NAD(P)-dependent dehydrogenase (short-subunit alcohol dehydrogenase family)